MPKEKAAPPFESFTVTGCCWGAFHVRVEPRPPDGDNGDPQRSFIERAIQEAIAGGWRDCKVELPPQKVLVWAWHNGWPRAMLAHIDSTGRWCGHYTDEPLCELREAGLPHDDPTYWRPLPAAPEEEEREG